MVERIFQIKDRWGNGIALWVIAFILFTAPLLVLVMKDVSLENDITTWLPHDDPDARSLDWFSNQFEKDNQIILSWDSSSLIDSRVDSLVRKLESEGQDQIPLINRVTWPTDIIQTMKDNKISEETAIERLTGVLIGVGFFKVQLTEYGRAHEQQAKQFVLSLIQEKMQRPVEALPPVRAVLPDINTPEDVKEVYDGIDYQIPPHDFQVRWDELDASDLRSYDLAKDLPFAELDGQLIVEKAFFAPGAPVALAISFEEADDKLLAGTLEQIEEAAQEIGIPTEELRMAGSPIGRLRLNQAARHAAWNQDYPIWNPYKKMPIILSAIVGTLASFILLRSVRLSMLVTAASVYTCLVVVAMIPLTGQSLNMVLIVLPDLLLVLTTSGAIHVANYWKHAVTLGEKNPVAAAVKMAWQPCLLASMTTAIGMASLITAVLEPVEQFGFYSSVGCLISLVMILIGFPSMMIAWPGRKKKYAEHAEQEATRWGHVARWILHHRRLITVTSCSLFVFSLIGLQWFQTETKVIRYFPKDSRISQDYHYLEEGLSGIVSVDAVIRFNDHAIEKMNISDRLQLVRDVEKKIADHKRISGTLSLADFRDPVEPPSEQSSTLNKIRYGRTLQRIEKGIFEEQSEDASQFAVKADQNFAVTTSTGREFSVLPGNEVWRIRAQSIVTGDINYASLTKELETLISETLQESPGTDYLVTGMVPLFLRTQRAVLESLIKSFGLAFIVIAGVMIILLRSVTSGILSMLPNLFPVGVVFGLVAWSGTAVDIGTMITASVALGIAIDGTLHLLTWYRDGIRHGMSQENAVVLALQHCGPAMWQTSATIALGIVIVSGADLLLISRFGILMAGLVVMALVADVVLLPALLGGWLGRVIARKTAVLPPESETAPGQAEEDATEQPSSEPVPEAVSSR